jgi:hypothetical protein
MTVACRSLVRKSNGKRPLVRSRRRWENNNKMNHREVGWEGVDWIHVPGNRVKWRAVVKAVVKLLVVQHSRNSFDCRRNYWLFQKDSVPWTN